MKNRYKIHKRENIASQQAEFLRTSFANKLLQMSSKTDYEPTNIYSSRSGQEMKYTSGHPV